jgi:hypothetical protein
MSDHGSAGYVQGVPDIRWDDDDLGCIKKFHVSDLEVVDNSALQISATSGQTKPYVVAATLTTGAAGSSYSFSFSAVGGNPATQQWSVASGALPPGLVLNASTGAISGLIDSSATGSYSFHITATDTSSGHSSAAQAFSIPVTPFTVTIQNTITIASAPAGLLVTVDGISYTTPQKFTWTQGSTHTVGTVSPQGTGTRNVFANWSDGGAATHSIVAPATATTYTANFATQYLLTVKASPESGGAVVFTPSASDGYYNAGTSVQVTAQPAHGHKFSGFTGDLTGLSNPQSLAMSAPRSVTAYFISQPRFSVGLGANGTLRRGATDATFTLAVAAESSAKTAGEISIVELAPAGVTVVSMSGAGWTCAAQTCTRRDSPGGSYPPISVTVRIAPDAASQLLNMTSVSGNATTQVLDIQ